MFVIHHAARLIEYLPTALPGAVAQIGVFEVKRPQQLVEAAQLEEFAAVEGAGSAAAVKARIRFRDRGVDAVTHAQAAILPPALREPGFLAQFRRIAEEDLARNREDFFVRERSEKWREKIRLDAHVAIEQHNDVVLRRAKAFVGAASETEIPLERQHADLRKVRPQEIRAAIVGAVIDDYDLVAAVAGHRFDHR